LLVLPGTHHGPTYDHHADGRFCGAMNPAACDLDFSKAVPLMGPAGSMTIHHARLVHGSALNRSNRQRRLLLHEYTAADAFPLMGIANFDEFNSRMVVGEPTIEPRIVPAPGATAAAAGGPPGLDLREPAQHGTALLRDLRGRTCLVPPGAFCCLAARLACCPVATFAAEQLHIGAARGTIDFAIGDSRLFRTTGSFKDWLGTVRVDDSEVSHSTVAVKVNTNSIDMLDPQQSAMLKDADFFDVARFPEMTYLSTRIDRTGETTLKVEGEITLRGITRPMALGCLRDRPQARRRRGRALRPLPRRRQPQALRVRHGEVHRHGGRQGRFLHPHRCLALTAATRRSPRSCIG
jgi:polyisoprenoid-binding protein YceI